jgi:hypothetical protein
MPPAACTAPTRALVWVCIPCALDALETACKPSQNAVCIPSLCSMRKGPAPRAAAMQGPVCRPTVQYWTVLLRAIKRRRGKALPSPATCSLPFFTGIGGMHPRVWLFLPALCRAFAASPDLLLPIGSGLVRQSADTVPLPCLPSGSSIKRSCSRILYARRAVLSVISCATWAMACL